MKIKLEEKEKKNKETLQRMEALRKKKALKKKHSQIKSSILCMSRKSSRLLLRLRLNSWNTKYVKDVKCVCGEEITIKHLLLECHFLQDLYLQSNIDTKVFSDVNFLLYDDKIFEIVKILLDSPLAELL